MLRIFCVPLLFACLAGGTLLLAEEKTKAEPAEMVTKVYKLPFNLIELGSSVSDPREPPDPFAAAPVASQFPHLPVFKSSREILEKLGVTFPPRATALFDPVTRELTLHNTAEAQEQTAALMDAIDWDGSTATLAFTVTVVEGPGKVIRAANEAASRKADAMPQLDALLAQAAQPSSAVRVVGEMFLETKSGMRATVEAVRERPEVEGVPTTTAAAAKAQASSGDEPPETRPAWTRPDGMKLELEPVLGVDGKTLEITFALTLGPEGPAMSSAGGRHLAPSVPSTGENAAAPEANKQTDPGLRKAHFVTGISIPSGSAKLIGITQPTGGAAVRKGGEKDILWAAFLTASVRRIKAQPGVVITAGGVPGKLPAGLRAVAFEVPEGLLESLIPADETFWAPRSLRGWLEGLGVTFPPQAFIEQRDGRLQVVNTPENIEIIAALVDHAWGKAAHSVAFTLHTFQVPATLMRPLVRQCAAAENADDSAMLAAVEAATARGEARAVSPAFFEGRNAKTTRRESGLEQSVMTRFGGTPTAGQSELVFQRQPVGEVVEIEPYVSADGRTVNLGCAYEMHPGQSASPRESLRAAGAMKNHDLPGADVPVLRTVTGFAMTSGTAKLLSLHHAAFLPGGDAGGPEMLWATFLQTHVVPQVRNPKPKPLPKKQANMERLREKMNKIIFPEVAFNGVTLDEACEYLRIQSRYLDTSTEADGAKGVSVILRPSASLSDASITLHLKDVPMAEALRYVTELAQLSYRVEEHFVTVGHGHDGEGQMHLRMYAVPRDFLSSGGPTICGPASQISAEALKNRRTAQQVLEGQGVTFPEGATASFITSTGTLLVQNTQPNLDLVESFCHSIAPGPVTTIAITAQVLQGPGPLLRRMAARAAPLNDHRTLRKELLAAVKAGTVQALDTARIETKSGTRATAEQGHEGAELTRLTLDGKGGCTLGDTPLFSGLRLYAEPLLMADEASLNLTVEAEFHTALPRLRHGHLIDDQGRRFDFPLTDTHRAHLTTELSLLDGHTRLLHLWKPAGSPEREKEDVLQVMFITCDVLRGPEE